jgi:hypothetical protein
MQKASKALIAQRAMARRVLVSNQEVSEGEDRGVEVVV